MRRVSRVLIPRPLPLAADLLELSGGRQWLSPRSPYQRISSPPIGTLTRSSGTIIICEGTEMHVASDGFANLQKPSGSASNLPETALSRAGAAL